MQQNLETIPSEEPQKKTTKEELINNIREWIKIDTDVAALKNDINTLKSKVGGRDDKTVVADIYKLCLELYYIYRAILVDLDPEKVKSYY